MARARRALPCGEAVVVVGSRIKGGAALPQRAADVLLLPERSRVKALRGSACPHACTRDANRHATSMPAETRADAGTPPVPGRFRSRYQAASEPWVHAGRVLVPLAFASALAGQQRSCRSGARDAKRKRARRGSRTGTTGSRRHRPSTKRALNKGAAPGARPPWPHQARRQRAARRRPGPSTPTP